MLKLLQINTTLNYGSTGRIAEQIALLAESHGWDCYIAHGGRYIGKSSIKAYQISSELDNSIHALKSMACGMHGLGSTHDTVRFVEWMKALKPDIIHLHNIHGYYINYQVLFDFLGAVGIPVVWTLHDCWPITGQCTQFVEVGCKKWKTGCHDCELLNYGYKTIIDRSLKNWQLKHNMFNLVRDMTIVPVSKWLESIVKESYLNEYPTRVIRNGIDIDVFKPLKISKKDYDLDEKFTILGVSSGWGREKGLDEMIKLSKNPEYQVVLIGVQDSLKWKLPKEIKALRRLYNQAELAAYYSLANVFVNPSHADSFPTVNLEALSCGTPLVTYKIGGSPEAVDEKTGAVVESSNVNALAEAIEYIRSNSPSSADCRKRAEQFFDKNKCFEEYVKLYYRMLNK